MLHKACLANHLLLVPDESEYSAVCCVTVPYAVCICRHGVVLHGMFSQRLRLLSDKHSVAMPNSFQDHDWLGVDHQG